MNPVDEIHLPTDIHHYLLRDSHHIEEACEILRDIKAGIELAPEQVPSCSRHDVCVASRKVNIARLPYSRMYVIARKTILFQHQFHEKTYTWTTHFLMALFYVS
jgi:hypothetical protein